MVSIVSRIDSAHRDIIHDAQMNFYGTKLATCSSDHLVKIFEVKPTGQSYLLTELSGHDGPVWQVAWAHPKFDNVLASCSYDKKVIIWKEISGKWQKIYESTQHEASVNSISWAPHQYGLILACASTDTSISVLTFNPKEGTWNVRKILKAHEQGCNAVSWCPYIQDSAAAGQETVNSEGKRIVSGGDDSLVKIWKDKGDGTWELEHCLEGHSDWVRDVAWSPVIMQDVHTIASCGQDKKVIIWRCSNVDQRKWNAIPIEEFDDALWHVSWSLCGRILAVSGGDNKISLWRENLQNQWIRISDAEVEKKGN